jgi:hypothetical protein
MKVKTVKLMKFNETMNVGRKVIAAGINKKNQKLAGNLLNKSLTP